MSLDAWAETLNPDDMPTEDMHSLLLLNNFVILEYSGMLGKSCLKLRKSQ